MYSDQAIREVADSFRARCWGKGGIPVDIELILERLGMDIIPVANLRDGAGVDACISKDLKSIYIDLGY